ncbi:MAG: DUF3147 family protein [Acidobacteriia bacterium]|nr:DUF3147 family protein [Terriglobia bacterium]MBV8903950.1 DUF3147 family protein [Terriglobia bacterium]
MLIKIDTSGLKQTEWHEYALRFLIGGAITVAAGLIAKFCGPVVGGLFLAFPAIFPASATLVAKHEEERKSNTGLHGRERGLDAAAVNAAGATAGSIGLAAFAAANWALLARHFGPLALLLSTAAWIAGAALAWWFWKRGHRFTAKVRVRSSIT